MIAIRASPWALFAVERLNTLRKSCVFEKGLQSCSSILVNRIVSRRNYGMRVRDASHLKGAVHHAHYVVELLVVQDGAVQLYVQAQLFGQTLPGCFAFQGAQGRRESLDTKNHSIR